jgi:hypothetical protein
VFARQACNAGLISVGAKIALGRSLHQNIELSIKSASRHRSGATVEEFGMPHVEYQQFTNLVA